MQPRVHPFASSPVTVVVAAIAGFRINIVGALVGIINFHAAYRQGQLPFLTYVVIVVMIDDLCLAPDDAFTKPAGKGSAPGKGVGSIDKILVCSRPHMIEAMRSHLQPFYASHIISG